MKVELKGFVTDADVDFTLIPEYVAEEVLLKAMRNREVEIIYPASTNGMAKLTFRASV